MKLTQEDGRLEPQAALGCCWAFGEEERKGKGADLLTPSSKQLSDLLTKAASPKVFFVLCSKLRIVNIYAPA